MDRKSSRSPPVVSRNRRGDRCFLWLAQEVPDRRSNERADWTARQEPACSSCSDGQVRRLGGYDQSRAPIWQHDWVDRDRDGVLTLIPSNSSAASASTTAASTTPTPASASATWIRVENAAALGPVRPWFTVGRLLVRIRQRAVGKDILLPLGRRPPLPFLGHTSPLSRFCITGLGTGLGRVALCLGRALNCRLSSIRRRCIPLGLVCGRGVY